MSSYVLGFQDIDRTDVAVVGGKGANLGEIARMEGIHVPDGFCIAAEAFKRILADAPALGGLLDRLARLKAEDREQIRELSGEVRRIIEAVAMPEDLQAAIAARLEEGAYAVRSSATAEDLPTASFAGQQDTYLNIVGQEAVLAHISKCWASLFTERAVSYRLQNGFDHRKVQMAVVVQKMVFPRSAGILFTADPVTANRKVSSIDAGFGLGDALVSGLVNPDVYKVRDGRVIDRRTAGDRQVLTDDQIVRLEGLGRRIEAHFGHPQDIEWCLADDEFYVVQSRPITTLFPVPETHDQDNHVYISVGHQQMMTDAIRPLGLSFWNLTTPRPMATAAGRLFVDIAQDLASPERRQMMVGVLGKSDPLIKDALTTILERENFIQTSPSAGQSPPPRAFDTLSDYDAEVVSDLIRERRASIEALKRNISTRTGPALFDFILEDIQELRKLMADPRSFGVIMSGMNASHWVNEKLLEWLGEKNVADTLAQSVPNNVTSEMGLDLLDLADAARPYPQVVDYFHHPKDDSFFDDLMQLDGGPEVRAAFERFLDQYGMRCAGEIDITRTRWSEKPATLVPMILGNIKNVEPGASRRRFEQGRQEALNKERELLERLRALPDGEEKAEETHRMIGLIRNLSGFREFPKYSMVSRYFVYKQALLKEADRLVQAGVLQDREDIYYLGFEELRDAVATQRVDHQAITRRKEAYRHYEKLTPPRVMTSEGEIIAGRYNRDNLPADAIAGLPVSSGVVEGRARVVLRLEDATLDEGDILVTSFTDPSWTALFVSIKGLVTEVGGLMTHGAVIAREYGLPAVVGVEKATKLIKDGQRIRVHGTEGYVELLS